MKNVLSTVITGSIIVLVAAVILLFPLCIVLAMIQFPAINLIIVPLILYCAGRTWEEL